MIQVKAHRMIVGFLFVFSSFMVNAQKGNHAVQAGIEGGIPYGAFGDFKNGPGLYGKVLYGVGTTGQLTLSTGYSTYHLRGSTRVHKERTVIKPLLAGYRYNWHGLYVEPQIGTGTYNLITTMQSGSLTTKTTDSKGGFTWALGGGISIRNIDLGVRYQQGYPSGDGVGLFVLHAGYQINF